MTFFSTPLLIVALSRPVAASYNKTKYLEVNSFDDFGRKYCEMTKIRVGKVSDNRGFSHLNPLTASKI